jgi:hypothetical protein
MLKYLPHILLSAASLVLGTGFGIVASPNYMRVHIDPFGKQNLGPVNGDVIEWDGFDPTYSKYDVSIRFLGNTQLPCVPGPLAKGVCVVNYPDPAGTYLYDCHNSSSGILVCPDPNLGPASSSGADTARAVTCSGWYWRFKILHGASKTSC